MYIQAVHRKRTKLADRVLPSYSLAEELTNAITHGIGAGLSIAALVLCITAAASHGNTYGVVTSAIYGAMMILLYTISCVYHSLAPCMGKKVMQIIDHCTIYFMIAGTYTVVVLSALRPSYPKIAWGMFFFEWVMVALAVTLNAIDLKKFERLSMIFYVGLGWAILPFMKQTWEVLGPGGFWFLLGGGIAYTIGSVMYAIGSRKRWMHSVFHVFVLIGSILQFFAVRLYAI